MGNCLGFLKAESFKDRCFGNDSASLDLLEKQEPVVYVGDTDDEDTDEVISFAGKLNNVHRADNIVNEEVDKLHGSNVGLLYNQRSLQWLYFQQMQSQNKKQLEMCCVLELDVVRECFAPLTYGDVYLVLHCWSNPNWRQVLARHENSNIDITPENLQCLLPGQWLSDEAINLYLSLLKEREEREPVKFLRCHFFSTFFFDKLSVSGTGYNYQSVKRWTALTRLGYSLLDCDRIFIPINRESHWSLGIINRKDEKFQYLDSLRCSDNGVLNLLASYYVDEVKDKSGTEIDVSRWKKETVEHLPRQENGYDCGVFMIKYVDFISRDFGLFFDQGDMVYFRLRTALEILRLRAG